MTVLNWLTALGRQSAMGPPPSGSAWADRISIFNLWAAYVDNKVYLPQSEGGQREAINSALGNAEAADLFGAYNPTAQIVDAYRNVYGGRFGEEIVIDNAKLRPYIDQVWKWSMLQRQIPLLCGLPATYGTMGLRIVDDVDRIRIKPEHPAIIRSVEDDAYGNVIGIELEYEETRGLGDEAETLTIREVLKPETTSTYRVDIGKNLHPFNMRDWRDDRTAEGAPNPLGIVPYVLCQHEYDGSIWGKNAFHRLRTPLDRVNALITHTDVQIHRHINGTLLIAADGAPPTAYDLTGLKVAYIDTRGSTKTPFAEWLVAKLDLPAALAQVIAQIDMIEDSAPETRIMSGKYLSGQSGETVIQLRKAAEEAILLARGNYEHALVTAQKIALSFGIMRGLWDLGTGTGTREAADRAYQTGLEDHAFNARPAFRSDARVTQPVTMPVEEEAQVMEAVDAIPTT